MRVLIADDEPLARSRLKRLLSQHRGFDCVGEAATGHETLALNDELQPDVVLLDIDMPGMDGLTTAEQLKAGTPPPAVIFVTAHPEHALDAYRSGPADYLVKPVSAERLAEALQRAGTPTRAHRERARPEPAWLHYQQAGRHRRIALDRTLYFVAEDKYVKAVHEEGEALLDESLRQLETRLGDAVLRIHRNTLVNRARILALHTGADGQHGIELAGLDRRLPVSRRMARRVRDELKSG